MHLGKFDFCILLQVNWLYTATDVMSTMRAAQMKTKSTSSGNNGNSIKGNNNNSSVTSEKHLWMHILSALKFIAIYSVYLFTIVIFFFQNTFTLVYHYWMLMETLGIKLQFTMTNKNIMNLKRKNHWKFEKFEEKKRKIGKNDAKNINFILLY